MVNFYVSLKKIKEMEDMLRGDIFSSLVVSQ